MQYRLACSPSLSVRGTSSRACWSLWLRPFRQRLFRLPRLREASNGSDSSVKAGAARVLAKAPSTMLRSVVTDYGRYSSIITQFKQARVLGRKDTQTDVYLEVPILEGAGKVWAVVRFSPPETVGDQEIIRGRLVKGNVKRLDATWRIKKLDDRSSELSLELLIVPDLPAPKSLITKELRKAAGKAVNGARNEAERRTRR
jgi:ribosome-associated toxin RatA of RatAB toxin-antitoxin module